MKEYRERKTRRDDILTEIQSVESDAKEKRAEAEKIRQEMDDIADNIADGVYPPPTDYISLRSPPPGDRLTALGKRAAEKESEAKELDKKVQSLLGWLTELEYYPSRTKLPPKLSDTTKSPSAATHNSPHKKGGPRRLWPGGTDEEWIDFWNILPYMGPFILALVLFFFFF